MVASHTRLILIDAKLKRVILCIGITKYLRSAAKWLPPVVTKEALKSTVAITFQSPIGANRCLGLSLSMDPPPDL
jgi:hypothetical protein